jgi:general secretion pathway protein C
MAATPALPDERRSPLATLLVVALVLLLAWQLARWTWVFLAPPRVATTPQGAAEVDLAAVAGLFGASPPAGTAAAGSSPLRLKGVIAPTPGVEASAIFSTGAGRDIAVFLDGEVQPGVKLVEVQPTHVMVSRAGVRERIDLEAARSAAAAPSPNQPRQGAFKLNVSRTGGNSFALSRKELDDALRDPNQLNYLGAINTLAGGGGVRMEAAPAGSLAQKLGLQAGDIIKKVNGQPVASAGDLARLYTQFGTISSIQADVQRGSAMVHLSYSIQ